MLLRRNIFLLGTKTRLISHCQSQGRLLFRVMQTSEFCLEEILKENLWTVHSNSCYLIHKGEILLALAQRALGCYWPVIPERRDVLRVGKRLVVCTRGLQEPQAELIRKLDLHQMGFQPNVKLVGSFTLVPLSSSGLISYFSSSSTRDPFVCWRNVTEPPVSVQKDRSAPSFYSSRF